MKLITDRGLKEFTEEISFDPLTIINERRNEEMQIDYFDYYNSVSSVYSSKIEGEEIDYDSFYKHKFLNIKYKPDYTKRADDLYSAYQFILNHSLSKTQVLKSHKLLTKSLLPSFERGALRTKDMFVIGASDRIEYVACKKQDVLVEFNKLFDDINKLLIQPLTAVESFYYAAMLHLVFIKIHPMSDGNGRTGRLLEKWFLISKIGRSAVSINLEKNYFLKRKEYYKNIRALGLEYETIDYGKSFDFVAMTIRSLQ